MEDLSVINNILISYKQAISEQIKDHDIGIQNKKRSSKFIELTTKSLMREFPLINDYFVFSKELPRDKYFNRSEFLFDIHVCKADTLTSIKNKKVKYIKESLIQIESEFAKDTSQVVIDFSKLVCGSGKLKIMIVSKCEDKDKFVESLKDIACNISENLYLIVLRHPSEWDTSSLQDYDVFYFSDNHWITVM